MARQALGEGMGIAGLYQRVIAPAMWRIGELWEQGAISVADEHLATALTHQAMARSTGPAIAEIQRVDPNPIVFFGGQGVRTRERNDRAVLVRDLEQLLGMVEAALDVTAPDPTDSSAPREPPPRVVETNTRRDADPASAGESAPEDESVERHLSGIASETADLARHLARQANTYKDLAYTDTLSGLPNRRVFEDRAARLSDFSDSKPLAVLTIDLDGLKPCHRGDAEDGDVGVGRSAPGTSSAVRRPGASCGPASAAARRSVLDRA